MAENNKKNGEVKDIVKKLRKRKKKAVVALGLIGGILVVTGIFLPWVAACPSGEVHSGNPSVSGWELATEPGKINEIKTEYYGLIGKEPVTEPARIYPYITLIGGILTIVACLGTLVSHAAKHGVLVVLMVLAEALIIISLIWGYQDIHGAAIIAPFISEVGSGFFISFLGFPLIGVGIIGAAKREGGEVKK